MTLSRFLTQYIYIPLGGNRKGKTRQCMNLFVVFLVSGFWHGANWTFILWGVLNGVAKVLDKLLYKPFRWIPKVLRIGITFIFTTFAWSLFRADSIGQASRISGINPSDIQVLAIYLRQHNLG